MDERGEPDLRIDQDGAEPPYQQLRTQLIDQIMRRLLPAGTKLPAVRTLAATLGLANNTVAKAYRELEAEGYVVTAGRAGTVVADIAPVDEAAALRAGELTLDYVRAMRRLGLGDDAILGTVRQLLWAGHAKGPAI
ncbi:GntR family transcriptional regulator [Tessaracoccus flavescens]|uniref:GntR family transcriptional regulator n=1 Tax=Tessaracoccus flavescens TaxID=399497 RepID=UPI001EFFF461|nr:GntR family transcriptional regulator [Tessaracoccus flavescens]